MIEKLLEEFRLLFAFKSSNNKWQKPLLTTISIGVPLLLGLYFGSLQFGLTACLSGLVIIYLPETGSYTNRILTLLVCSFGFIASSAFGYFFSFHPVVSIIAFGLFTVVVHWIILFYKTSPPKSFFFILIAAMSICQPFDIASIPLKVGLMTLGTMLTCMFALLYLLYLSIKDPKANQDKIVPIFKPNPYADVWETIIFGGLMSTSLGIGYYLQLDNPYWIPISCAAVMQGVSLHHVRQRMIQRILGTFVGIGFTWCLFHFIDYTPITICISIIILQLVIEMLVVRQYALAVVFITPFTILLNEAANPLFHSTNTLIVLRFEEIVIGSILGAIGGWLTYKEKIRHKSINKIEGLMKI
ncbi:FUSC family protein [Flammeovirga sp. MY04]|uniref:FUSC family protein n=1 Tax=Flammeovirga sp. MY04 TaxID=1191459 RepID=UPI0008064252|nr:FUSC family protein [Flammeovirga sp. MY04]ANQ51788.1 FUSC family protein [Flammeovirga sp. MY04]